MDYKKYAVGDFVADKYFREWVLNPSRESQDFWEGWMVENPTKAKLIVEARQVILNMAFDEHEISEHEIDNLWQEIDAKVSSHEERSKPVPHRYIFPERPAYRIRSRVWRVAAAVSILVSCMALLLYMTVGRTYWEWQEIASNYGEIKTVTLSDGSVVNLNANSKIKFRKTWEENEVREVWLEGEAYFKVVHTVSDALFKVRANGVEIDVLGTEFNVYGRNEMAKIVLEEGKVRLKSSQSEQKMDLAPGDLVTFNNQNLSLNKSRVDTRLYTSWKDQKLFFQRTSLDELSTIMKENYNLDFFFLDANLAEEEFTGVIPTDDVDVLISSLSEAFGINIEKKGKALILRRKTQNETK